MLVRDITSFEREYYAEKNEMAVLRLLCNYYEEKKYELVYYLSKRHFEQDGLAAFYWMMSAFELGDWNSVWIIYKRNQGDWFQICKQYGVYWRHTALFALYFFQINITDFYQEEFDRHYDDMLVRLFELIQEENPKEVVKSDVYRLVAKQYPMVGQLWDLEEEKLKKEVITFENIQWRIWNRYNEKIGLREYLGFSMVYNNEGIKIFSYKPKCAAAAVTVITDEETTIILDCGGEMTENGRERVPIRQFLRHIGAEQVNGVFISHAHADHYGSLNELKDCKIFMTSITRQLIWCASPDMALGSVQILEPYSSINFGHIAVRFVPSGHMIGSVMMDIYWRGKRIVYTGDYGVVRQCTTEGFQTADILEANPEAVDVLITETTFGKNADMLSLKQYQIIFREICMKQYQYGNKVLVVCSAVGQLQEAVLLLSDMARKTGAKLLIDGAAARMTENYQLLTGMEILNRNVSACYSELEYSERISNYDILLVNSAMFTPQSTAAEYIAAFLEGKKVCMIKAGHLPSSRYLMQSIKNRMSYHLNYFDIPLIAHAAYKELKETIEELKPDCVIYVHGTGIL